jgi:hypothetical protein
MAPRPRSLLLVIVVLLCLTTPAAAAPIQTLPGLLDVNVCVQGGYYECAGLTRTQLQAAPNAPHVMTISGSPDVLRGGLTNAIGDYGEGDEYLLITFTRRAPYRFLLDAVFLFFDESQSPRYEPASFIANTGGLVLAPGYTAADLNLALSLPDGNWVEVIEGSIVFGFTSSAPSPVPEPGTALLLGAGLVVVLVGRRCGHSH